MKTFPIKLSDELHDTIRTRAFHNKISIHAYLLSAINFAMSAESPNPKEETPNVPIDLSAPN